MATQYRRPWRRSRATTALIYRIRGIIREAGYDEECAIAPLAKTFSVLVNQGEEMFNLRLDKNTLAIVSTEQLKYNRRRENIRLVFRRKV
jgi:hypothetical protein